MKQANNWSDIVLYGCIGFLWFVCGCLLGYKKPIFYEYVSVFCIAMAIYRCCRCIKLAKNKYRLNQSELLKISLSGLEKKSKECQTQGIWLGKGFCWQDTHTKALKTLLDQGTEKVTYFDAMLNKLFKQKKDVKIGEARIHRIENKEQDIVLSHEALQGHTFITGTTGSGKTRLYELISTQIIESGDGLIVIDPKGDIDWENRLRQICKKVNRRFLYLSPAHLEQSIRFQPLMNWQNISEPATRIAQLVDAKDSFLSFAWKTLFCIMRAMVANGERPNIKKAKYYADGGMEMLLTHLIQKELKKKEGEQWDANLSQFKPSMSSKLVTQNKDLITLINKYQTLKINHEVIDDLIMLVTHPHEHYQKMILALQPIMAMLGSDEIGQLLSPNPYDTTDLRPIYDAQKVIRLNAVLYVGLDALSNRIVGHAIASILLGDIAATAGAIYNSGYKKQKRVYLMIDEAGEVLNDQAIQILNKGRGAGFRALIATQTMADLDVLFNSHEKSRQVLGNLNNVICLRLRDVEMAKYMSNLFGKVINYKKSQSQNSRASSDQMITQYVLTSGQSFSPETIDKIAPEWLMQLPSLEYVASFAGSTIFKGKIPIIED